MTYYRIIKTVSILFFLLQIFGIIGQLGTIFLALGMFKGSLSSAFELLASLVIILSTIAIVYYCILKIDKILYFFNIHLLFEEDEKLEINSSLNRNWITLVLICLGIFTSVPALADVLVQGSKFIQNSVHNQGYDYIIMQSETNPNLFIENIIKVVCGTLLITQSNYLGRIIVSKVEIES